MQAHDVIGHEVHGEPASPASGLRPSDLVNGGDATSVNGQMAERTPKDRGSCSTSAQSTASNDSPAASSTRLVQLQKDSDEPLVSWNTDRCLILSVHCDRLLLLVVALSLCVVGLIGSDLCAVITTTTTFTEFIGLFCLEHSVFQPLSSVA